MDSASAGYRRQGAKGCLKLGAIADISEAQLLYTASRQALADEKATTMLVDLSQVETLDISAMQILLALKNDVQASGRTFATEGLSVEWKERLEKLGLSLDSVRANLSSN